MPNLLNGSPYWGQIIYCLWKALIYGQKDLKILLLEYNLNKNKDNQTPYMVNKSKRCKMITLLKSLKNINILNVIVLTVLILMTLTK